jgi:hypothetical protein
MAFEGRTAAGKGAALPLKAIVESHPPGGK